MRRALMNKYARVDTRCRAEPLRTNASLGGEKTDTNTNCSEESTGPAAGTQLNELATLSCHRRRNSMDMFASGIVKVRTPSVSRRP